MEVIEAGNKKRICPVVDVTLISVEKITYDNAGVEAIVFTAEGDMRQVQF
jgi:hypothetical protein